ncbi:MAG: hypothetical protein CMG00_00340 [Candidatus Marinimicrobia bacterium]|nr:hypothetical protein [Candidatus Neomarinimicrobiota bacterium]|tara:strand:- start:5739 stop:6938 length:1200 start_codon:yes stop_codon:yes gene_type:complete
MQIKYFNSTFDHIKNTTSYDKKIIDEISKLPAFNIIFNEKLLNETLEIINQFKVNKKKIVLLGTGGSNLGARALHNINKNKKINIEFYDNVDPITFENSFNNVNFKDTGFIIISKSGNTPETLAQFSSLYQIALQKNNIDQFLSNILIITEFKSSPLYKISKEKNCLTLEHNNKIGGRFSVFSNVGVVPAILSGLNIRDLYSGAAEILNNIEKYSVFNLSKFLCMQEQRQYSSNVLMTYSDNLYFFGKWYLQLWAESIGKNKKGITAIHSVGTTDQHSQLQLYLDGPNDKFFTFITTDHSNKGPIINNDIFKNTEIKYFKNKRIGDLMDAEQRATLETFKLNNFSYREIFLPKIDEKNIGKLMSLSMIETIASCIYFDVNPFDQPAVEQGKILTKKYLS